MIKKKKITSVDWANIMPNMPVATSNNKGLMSNNYVIRYNCITVSDYSLIKIISVTQPWTRCSVMISGSLEGRPYLAIVGVIYNNTTLKAVVHRFSKNEIPQPEFYKKGEELYMFCNLSASSPNALFLQSTQPVQRVNFGNPDIIDDSYEKITVQSVWKE